jgi:hypothetical protein
VISNQHVVRNMERVKYLNGWETCNVCVRWPVIVMFVAMENTSVLIAHMVNDLRTRSRTVKPSLVLLSTSQKIKLQQRYSNSCLKHKAFNGYLLFS